MGFLLSTSLGSFPAGSKLDAVVNPSCFWIVVLGVGYARDWPACGQDLPVAMCAAREDELLCLSLSQGCLNIPKPTAVSDSDPVHLPHGLVGGPRSTLCLGGGEKAL